MQRSGSTVGKASFILIFCLVAFDLGVGQTPESPDVSSFAEQISENSSFEQIKAVVSTAQKSFERTSKKLNRKQIEYADLLLDLASVRKKAFLIFNSKFYVEGGEPTKERLKYLDSHHQNGAALLKNLEDAISIFELTGVENERRAEANFELAWLYQNYPLPEKFARTLSERGQKMRSIERRYRSAYDLREKIHGSTHESTLVTKYYLAESYLKGSNFEKALPLFASYISLTEKQFGRKFPPLLLALRHYRSLLWMTGLSEELPKVEQHIFEITGHRDEDPITLLNLSLRSKNLNYKGLRELEGNLNPTVSEENYYYSTGRVQLRGDNPEIRTPPKVKLLGTGDQSSGVWRTRATLVRVVINESGRVETATAETTDSNKRQTIEQRVKSWEFAPFIYEGSARKMHGVVYYSESELMPEGRIR